MIETEKSILIGAAIDNVWDYVQDIERWANLFPGCRDCEVIDENNSRWTIKVGAGGLVRTVNVLVHIDQWDGPERVNFSYQLEAEPVVGSGSYIASQKGAHETEITLQVRVEGSGPVAPMWEAVSKPLLPQLAKTFTKRLKGEIEEPVATPASQTDTTSFFAATGKWLRKFWGAIFGSETK